MSELDQVTVFSTASAGVIVAVSCSVCPTVVKAILLLSKANQEICIGASPK